MIKKERGSWILNWDRGLVEVKFPRKPAEVVRKRLSETGFRWFGLDGSWRADDSVCSRQVANEVASHYGIVGHFKKAYSKAGFG